MRKLSFTISFLLWITVLFGQSPHGKGLKTDCSYCHTAAGWKVDWKTMTFNHDTTLFKLVGQHRLVKCRSCHKSLEFSTTKSECINCHDDLHETTLGPDCARCHTPKSWIIENISEIHRQSRFPLTGAHQISDCIACHKSGSMRRFDPLGIDCIDCHRATYLATTKPNHLAAGYSTNCSQCHSASSAGWGTTNIEHNFFALTGGHAIDCTLCHLSGDYKKISTDCYSCHQGDYNSTTIINHKQLGFSVNCLDCHTTNPAWKPAKFAEHDVRFFPVYSGRHSGAWSNCADCHKQTDNFSIFSCIDCHEHAKTRMDDEHGEANGYQYNSIACFTCHPTGNKEGGFNHSKTNFPLTGAHINTDCIGCHANGFAGTSLDCNSCHKAKFDQAQAPVHTTAGIPLECETCHSTTAWKPSTFNHSSTGYVLTGGHAKVGQCSDCHKGTVVNTQTECIACHQVQFDNAKDHKNPAFSGDCKLCHNFDNWADATFNHAITNYPLTGAHTKALCAQCHITKYSGTPTDCNSCHGAAFTSALNPNHVAAGLPKECEPCHSTTAWKPSSFNHVTTGFELTGGHAVITQCSDCHKGTVLNSKTDCITCHQVQYDTAKDHKSKAYPQECNVCHNTINWLNASFNHALTSFPLTGAHTAVLCTLCHISSYSGTPTDCNSCHGTAFSSAMNPNHVAAGLPTLCETCHNTTAWKPSPFNHVTTGFELTGGHAVITQCSDCHKGTVLNTKTDCIACHQVQYDNAKDHKTLAYPQDCKMCHNSGNWLNATFNHSTTSFPLTGAHVTTLCSKCHISGFSNTPTTCISCHQTNYNEASNPNHKSLGLSVNCSDCHSTNAGWIPASFPVHDNYYVLSGAHSGIGSNCALCHKGNYSTTPNTCYGCHAAKYNSTTNPNHATAQFPKECESCHGVVAWTPATWNHDSQFFPIYSGKHKGKWTLCSECHTTATSYAVFSCINCHEHNKTSMDSEHKGIANYAYNSVACYTCHPRGNT